MAGQLVVKVIGCRLYIYDVKARRITVIDRIPPAAASAFAVLRQNWKNRKSLHVSGRCPAPLNIAILFDGPNIPPKDGVSFHFYHLARHLCALGIRVHAFLGDRGWATVAQLQREPFISHMFPAPDFYKDQRPIINILQREQVAVIHVANSHPAAVLCGQGLAEATDLPLTSEMHDVDASLFKMLGFSQSEVELAQFTQYVAAVVSNAVVVISPHDYRELTTTIGIPSSRLTVIPSGIDCSEYQPTGPSSSGRVVLFVGNLYYAPNAQAVVHIAERIAPEVLRADPEVLFYIAGRTPPDSRRRYASCPGLVFLGEVDDLRQVLAKATIAIAPLTAGSGMKVKILTYAAAGLPVLTTRIGAMGYRFGKGIIIDDGLRRYPRRILHLLNNPLWLRHVGLKARQVVEEHYDWPDLSRCYRAFFQGLCGTRWSDIWRHASLTQTVRRRAILGSIYRGRRFRSIPYPMPLWMKEQRFGAYRPRDVYIRIDGNRVTEVPLSCLR